MRTYKHQQLRSVHVAFIALAAPTTVTSQKAETLILTVVLSSRTHAPKMPVRLSKFAIDATCAEYSHPWTSSCVNSTAGLGLHAFEESLRIYSTLYLFALLMKRKKPTKEDIKKTILSILQSTAFLAWSGFSYSMFICCLSRLLGHLNFLTVSFLPSFLSSLTAILIERPSRRPLLCLYVSNIATETLFRMGVWRGYFSPIPKGEIYIFAVSAAVLLYFFRSKVNKQDSIYKILRLIIGPYEEVEYAVKKDLHSKALENIEGSSTEENRDVQKKCQKNKLNILLKFFEIYKYLINILKTRSKHASCPHPYSCVHYVLTGSAKAFSYGIGGQLALNLIFQFKKLLRNPKLVRSTIFRRENLNLGIFLGGCSGLFKLMSCLLRRTFHKDSYTYAIPAGLIASIAFMAYPNNVIALYFMWKALQLLWNNALESGKVPEIKWFMILWYCLSTALLFHTAIIEPQNLRSSYFKFLYNMSGGRIAVMSRIPIDMFGLESSKHLQDVLRKTHLTDQINYSF